MPSGTWRGAGGVTWSFTANPGDESGETWFFFGSNATSGPGPRQQDWGNLCNWYSSKTTSPSDIGDIIGRLDKRATRLPPEDAVVHVYSDLSTSSVGPRTVKSIYFWNGGLQAGSEITTTHAAHDSPFGCVLTSYLNNPLPNAGIVNNGATFNGTRENWGTVNGGAIFNNNTLNVNLATVNGGATFNDTTINLGGFVNGGAVFNNFSYNNGSVSGGATFNDDAFSFGGVNGGASFNDSSHNYATVNGGGTFNDSSSNRGTVNGGATFNNTSTNGSTGTVNDGAVFNDAACSFRFTGSIFVTPCTRKFVAHPTDLPTCNGTAPNGCANAADSCGCG